MRRRISLASILLIFFCIFLFLYESGVSWFCVKNVQNQVQEYIEQLSFEQKWFLSNLCKECIAESSMGFTLFGDKPISSTTLRGQSINRRYFFRTMALPLLRKYEGMLRSEKFVLLLDETPTEIFLYLVNKKAFINIVRENIDIFRSVLGEAVTPESLLTEIISKRCTVEAALKGSHLLFGILYGFGTNNALCFDRRQRIENEADQFGIPPWKDPHRCDTMKMEDWVFFYLNRKNFIEKCRRESIFSVRAATAAVFSTIQEELRELDQKIVFVWQDRCPPGPLMCIEPPGFMGDPCSEETQKRMVAYEMQRKFLTKLMYEKNFLQKIVKTFYEID